MAYEIDGAVFFRLLDKTKCKSGNYLYEITCILAIRKKASIEPYPHVGSIIKNKIAIFFLSG